MWRWVSEHLQHVFWGHSVVSYHKPFNTLRSKLVRPKDKTPPEEECELVYRVECRVCHKQYIGKTENPRQEFQVTY